MTLPSEQSIPIAPGAFDQDRPVGLFYRLKVDFMSGGRLEVRTLLFLAGVRMVRAFPFGGAFDPSRCNPDTCGSHRHDGDEIAVRWDDDQADQWRYARTPEGFELDGDSYKPARPLTAAELAGTWAGAGNVGNPAENVYTFDSGGTFTFGTTGSGVGGRYSIDGLTLSLAFADGSEVGHALFAAGSGEPVGIICVEGDAYRRQ